MKDSLNSAIALVLWLVTITVSILTGYLAWDVINPESFLGGVGFIIVWAVFTWIARWIIFAIGIAVMAGVNTGVSANTPIVPAPTGKPSPVAQTQELATNRMNAQSTGRGSYTFSILTSYDSHRLQSILSANDIDSIDGLFDLDNARLWNETLSWKLLTERRCVGTTLVVEQDLIPGRSNHNLIEQFDHVLFDFLIPDNIVCSIWLINYLAISDHYHSAELEELLDEDVKYLAESNALYGLPAYPKWFQAAYPKAVQWLSDEQTGAITELSKQTHKLLEDEVSKLEFGQTFTPTLLRLIKNDCHIYQAKQDAARKLMSQNGQPTTNDDLDISEDEPIV